MKGEKGYWIGGGFIWLFGVGVIGVFGVLGIILVFKFCGSLVYVMFLVFGCVLVMNMFVIMFMVKFF